MNLQQRIDLLVRLGQYILSDPESWKEQKMEAEIHNKWFTQPFIEQATGNIAREFLNPEKLKGLADIYAIPAENNNPKLVGLVMAGNIPLVGFHDFLAVFLTGHKAMIKTSSKDEILFRHLIELLFEWENKTRSYFQFATLLKGADAYIATGSNNSARYFDYYFGKYPHIIRRNRTSVAILDGDETPLELEKLADDIHQYFGLGCRNVTKLFVPEGYDFIPLLNSFEKYKELLDHHKFKNNYDYQLAIHLLNNKKYMTGGSILLSEAESVFSPISQLNYSFYSDKKALEDSLSANQDIQCIIGKDHLPFGISQCPSLTDFADGADTIQFLLNLTD